MVEALSLFDFERWLEDMEAISALDTNSSLFLDHRDSEMVKHLGKTKRNI